MLNFFRNVPVYIKIYPDAIEITNLRTGETLSRKSEERFSSDRLLIAEFRIVQNLLKGMLKELKLSNKGLKILIHQMKAFEADMSESEKRILRDLAEQAGARTVYIGTKPASLSDDEAREILQGN